MQAYFIDYSLWTACLPEKFRYFTGFLELQLGKWIGPREEKLLSQK